MAGADRMVPPVRQALLGALRPGVRELGRCWLCGWSWQASRNAGCGGSRVAGHAEESAHELVAIERHDLLAVGTCASIVFVAEGDAILVQGDQPPGCR